MKPATVQEKKTVKSERDDFSDRVLNVLLQERHTKAIEKCKRALVRQLRALGYGVRITVIPDEHPSRA